MHRYALEIAIEYYPGSDNLVKRGRVEYIFANSVNDAVSQSKHFLKEGEELHQIKRDKDIVWDYFNGSGIYK